MSTIAGRTRRKKTDLPQQSEGQVLHLECCHHMQLSDLESCACLSHFERIARRLALLIPLQPEHGHVAVAFATVRAQVLLNNTRGKERKEQKSVSVSWL